MEHGFHKAELELRRRSSGAVALRGRFPYGKAAVLTDGGRRGRPKKEVFAPRAFAYRVDRPDEDIHLLIGHSYDRPLASRSAGTLALTDSDDALSFEAEIGPELQEAGYIQDALAGLRAGLIVGISPGFRIPPERVEPDAETVSEEDPRLGMALIRMINAALLYELSLVTRPAFSETEVEERAHVMTPARVHPFHRWRL